MNPLRALPLPLSVLRLAALPALLIVALAFGAFEAAAQSPPGTPSSVSATRGNGTLSVAWSAVSNATSYNVNTTSNWKKSWQRAASNVSGTSVTLTGIDNDFAYFVSVQAVNANGLGGWRDSGVIQTLQTATAPASVSLARGAGYLDVSWTAPSSDGGNSITGYDVVISGDGKVSWWRAATNVNPPILIEDIHTYRVSSGIDDGKSYHAAVRAVSAAGPGPWKNAGPIASQSLPGTPSSVSATRGNGTLNVTWSAASNATGYNINATSNWKKSWQRAASNVSGTSTTLTGINNAATYYISIQAVNSVGGGGWRNSDAIDTLRTATAPASVSLSRGAGYLDVSWTAPSSDGGNSITGYDIVVSDSKTSWWRAATETNPTPVNGTYTYRVTTGIDDAKFYHAAVRAVSAAGPGPWKNAGPIYP